MSHASPTNEVAAKISRLKDRAKMLDEARQFFKARNVLEVDCPILSALAAVEAHIDLFTATTDHQTRYLHSSPEMGMKRLLVEGIGDIFQLSHVFRAGEWSAKHNPEFMMAEWYRLNFTLEDLIEETVHFIRLFLGELPYQILSYRDLFKQETGLDYFTSTEEELFHYIQAQAIPYYPSLQNEGKDALLNLILGTLIEPKLGWNELCVLAFYPASQAALARKRWHREEPVAERFEIYFQGLELANGFHELADAEEQRLRFAEANAARRDLGKETLPPDERFIEALSRGLPDCSGVAVGFDRLIMLRQGQVDISKVLSWSWGEA